MEEEINDYGNRVAKITLDFIKGEYSESVRDSMYKDAGYYLLEKLNTTINLAVSKERERIVEMIEKEIDRIKNGDIKWVGLRKALKLIQNERTI